MTVSKCRKYGLTLLRRFATQWLAGVTLLLDRLPWRLAPEKALLIATLCGTLLIAPLRNFSAADDGAQTRRALGGGDDRARRLGG